MLFTSNAAFTFLGSVAESRPRTLAVSGVRKVSAGVKMQISEMADFKGLKKKKSNTGNKSTVNIKVCSESPA